MDVADAFDVRRTLRRDLEVAVTARIRRHLRKVGMSESDLGRSLGLSQAAISRRFVGLSRWEMDDLVAVAETLGTTLDSIVGA